MSSQPIILDDPEKGTSEVLESTVPTLEMDEEKAQVHVSVSAVAQSKTIIPPKKPQRKISPLVRLQLWFNTYR